MDLKKRHSLSFSQVQKLESVLSEDIVIRPTNNFPELKVTPASIVKVVRRRLNERSIKLRDVRLNGSAASHCLCADHVHYNDIDLIFGLEDFGPDTFRAIKEEVVLSLLDFLPKGTSKEKISCHLLEETYVRKMVLISNVDNDWSLISLGNEMSIELKFVGRMKRQYEFTIDSFQISLDSYLNYHDCRSTADQSFYPSAQAVSIYPDFDEALHHLNNQLIHTENPEEIRGGGLLKYCNLLVQGYEIARPEYMEEMEPYMCSRFFIDFTTADEQYQKVHQYIVGRFLQYGHVGTAVHFLDTLYHVVLHKSTCLMESKRHLALTVIQQLKNICFFPNPLLFPPFGLAPPAPHSVVGGPPSPPFIPPPSLPGPAQFTFEPLRMSPPPHLSFPQQPSWICGPMPTTQVR